MLIIKILHLKTLKLLNFKHFFLPVLLFCLPLGCNGYKHSTIPNVYVSFSVSPNDVLFLDLNVPGGSMYFTGGVNGVVVYRIGEIEGFSAFDRACPYDWDDPDEPRVWVENGITLKCEKCGSIFNILDGTVIKGPSKYPLKQYYTNYDGYQLRVHS